MNSIKEKAIVYGLLNPDIHYYNDGGSYDNHDKPAEDFEAGANYVIKQIENILSHPLKYVHSDKSVEEGMIADIANIVKQLNGE
jgi:hypothetical protein